MVGSPGGKNPDLDSPDSRSIAAEPPPADTAPSDMPTCGVAGCAVHNPFIADWFDVPWYPGKHHVDIGCNRADHRGVSCRAWMKAVGRSDKPIDVSLPQPAPPWCGYAGCATHPERRNLRGPSDRRLNPAPMLTAEDLRAARDAMWQEVQTRRARTNLEPMIDQVTIDDEPVRVTAATPARAPFVRYELQYTNSTGQRSTKTVYVGAPLGNPIGTSLHGAVLDSIDRALRDWAICPPSTEPYTIDGGALFDEKWGTGPLRIEDNEIKGVETKVDVFPTVLAPTTGRLANSIGPGDPIINTDLAPHMQAGDVIKIGRGKRKPIELAKVEFVCPMTGHSDAALVRGFGGTEAKHWRGGQRIEIVSHELYAPQIPIQRMMQEVRDKVHEMAGLAGIVNPLNRPTTP